MVVLVAGEGAAPHGRPPPPLVAPPEAEPPAPPPAAACPGRGLSPSGASSRQDLTPGRGACMSATTWCHSPAGERGSPLPIRNASPTALWPEKQG